MLVLLLLLLLCLRQAPEALRDVQASRTAAIAYVDQSGTVPGSGSSFSTPAPPHTASPAPTTQRVQPHIHEALEHDVLDRSMDWVAKGPQYCGLDRALAQTLISKGLGIPGRRLLAMRLLHRCQCELQSRGGINEHYQSTWRHTLQAEYERLAHASRRSPHRRPRHTFVEPEQ